MTDDTTRARLEYLRGELRAERISMSELAELQSLVEHIDPGDVELLEAAGVPEHAEEEDRIDLVFTVEISVTESAYENAGGIGANELETAIYRGVEAVDSPDAVTVVKL